MGNRYDLEKRYRRVEDICRGEPEIAHVELSSTTLEGTLQTIKERIRPYRAPYADPIIRQV